MSAPILKVDITANAKQLELAINKATAKIKELGDKIQSLPTGDKQFNKLARELARTENTFNQLNKSYSKLGIESEQVAPKLQQVANSSKSARTALTSLSLTIQDLPFGFLGIQNNLPGVIQGFGNLTTTTNGKVLPALKEIGKSLIGPAGIFLAFSAVTSIITVLVQKYGSLGNALDALLGKQNAFKLQLQEQLKVLDEYNKKQQNVKQITDEAAASQSGQIAVIESLVRAGTNRNNSLEEQQKYLNQLSTIDKDYFGNLKAGKDNVDKIREAAEKYTRVLIAQAKVKALSNELDNIAKLVVKNDELLVGAQESLKTNQRQYDVNKALFPILYKIRAATTGLNSDIKDSGESIDTLANSIFDLNNKGQKLADQIDAINKELVDNTVVTGEATKAVKKYFEEYKPPKAYLDFIDFYSNENLLQRGTQAFNDLNRIDLTNGAQALVDFQQILKQLQDDFPIDFTGFEQPTLKTLPAAIKKVGEILKRELDYVALDIAETDIISQLIEKIRKDLEKATEKIKKSEGKIFIDIPLDTSNVYGKGPGTFEQVMAPTLKRREEMKKEAQELVQNLRDTANLMGEVFFNPLQDQFKNLLETGKFSFKEFGRAVLDNMKQLAAKLLATGIVTLLATIATGGFSAATQAKTGLTGFQAFGKAFLGQLGFGPQRGPNLANIGAGGLAMSGAVNLTLRGSDLVGALNRTNTNINRIG